MAETQRAQARRDLFILHTDVPWLLFQRVLQMTMQNMVHFTFRTSIFRYIYLDEIVFSMDNALSAFYLSKKYMVTSFQDDVLDYIRKNLSAANVCQYLPATQLFDELHDR